MAGILFSSCAVRIHDSQAYRKMDVTRERLIMKRIKTHLIADEISIRGTLRILQFQLDVNGSRALSSKMTCL